MYFFKVYTPHYHIKIKIKQKEKEVLEEAKLIFQPRKYIYILLIEFTLNVIWIDKNIILISCIVHLILTCIIFVLNIIL